MEGLEGLAASFGNDTNQLIYHKFESPEKLDCKIAEARSKYGHSAKAKIFIDGTDKSNDVFVLHSFNTHSHLVTAQLPSVNVGMEN